MVRFERMKEILKPKHYKELCKFMDGQTIEFDKNGHSIIFDDDLLKWLEGLECTD